MIEKLHSLHRIKRILSAILIITAFLVISGCGEEKKDMVADNTFKSVSMEEGKKIIESESGYIILDVRTKEEYDEGHIPGAINVANEDISTSMQSIEQLPDKKQKILVYCRSGNRSKQAAKKLAAIGYSNVVEFGGIIEWKGEIEK